MPHDHKRPVIDLSGKVIGSGAIKLLNPIGAGAFGTVYRARNLDQTSTKPHYYAVKVLSVPSKKSRRAGYLKREINLHSFVSDHRNVVTLHYVYRDDDYLYIVMTYCPGGDLHRYISQRDGFVGNDVVIKRIFLQLIDAVQTCHDRYVFHRDIKPGNVFVSEDLKEIYLGDFGLAIDSSRSSKFGAGSAYWMCPECADGDGDSKHYSTRRGDIWSLGILLVNMITTKSPWRRATLDDCGFRAYLMHGGEFLRGMLPISESACNILVRIFAPNPKDCISLRELRKLVGKVDTFYMSEEDVAASNHHVKATWEECKPGHEVPPPPEDKVEVVQKRVPRTESNSLEDDSNDSNERPGGLSTGALLHLEEGHPDHRTSSSRPSSETLETGIQLIIVGSTSEGIPENSLLQIPGTLISSRSSSERSSDLPVTPETHAQNPPLIVSSTKDDENLSQLDLPPAGTLRKKIAHNVSCISVRSPY